MDTALIGDGAGALTAGGAGLTGVGTKMRLCIAGTIGIELMKRLASDCGSIIVSDEVVEALASALLDDEEDDGETGPNEDDELFLVARADFSLVGANVRANANGVTVCHSIKSANIWHNIICAGNRLPKFTIIFLFILLSPINR
jgi:hypothetical protein